MGFFAANNFDEEKKSQVTPSINLNSQHRIFKFS